MHGRSMFVVSSIVAGLLLSAPLGKAQEAAVAAPDKSAGVVTTTGRATDVVDEMRKLVDRAQKALLPTLDDLKQKQARIEKVEQAYDEALEELEKLAELAKPGGEFEQQINLLKKKAAEAIARLEHHRIAKLRKLVDLVYRPETEKLIQYSNDMGKFYGSILAKIRQLKEDREVAIELTRAKLFQDAVALVGKATNEYKRMDEDLGQIGRKVSETEERLGVTTE